MACGSVAQSENVISLASLNLARRDRPSNSSSASSDKSDTPSKSGLRSFGRFVCNFFYFYLYNIV